MFEGKNDTHYHLISLLTDKQRQAIGLIVIGLTDQEVAKQVGVRRETISRWKNHQIAFQTLINIMRREHFEEMKARHLHLMTLAINCTAKAIEKGNVDAALAVLKQFESCRPSVASTSMTKLYEKHQENGTDWDLYYSDEDDEYPEKGDEK